MRDHDHMLERAGDLAYLLGLGIAGGAVIADGRDLVAGLWTAAALLVLAFVLFIAAGFVARALERQPCPDCGGSGLLEVGSALDDGEVADWLEQGGSVHDDVPCDTCHGRGTRR